jgi:hypothetical protein
LRRKRAMTMIMSHTIKTQELTAIGKPEQANN